MKTQKRDIEDEMMTEALVNTVRSLADIPDDQIEKMLTITGQQSIKKGQYFIKAGEIPKQFGFVLKGCFRYFYLTPEGKDFTKGFIVENGFLSSYSAMISNRGSYFSIEALEDAEIIIFDYSKWKKLIVLHHCWDTLLKVILEKAFTIKENREKSFLLENAETRYRAFLKDFPNLEQRVKQYHIASYLGITPVALSRIRKTI